MRFSLFLFVFLPLIANGQLDRVHPNMTEQEFTKAIPEAIRSLESEAGWVGDTANVNGISGNALWRIYNDTISVYRFNSVAVDGPSDEYPRVDSASVHALRESAEKTRRQLESQLGKPTSFRNNSFVPNSMIDVPVVYLANWTYPDKSEIRIMISKELSAGNMINAPVFINQKKAEKYEMSIYISSRSLFTRVSYSIGKSSEEFFEKYPQCRDEAGFLKYHRYILKDTLTGDNAEWEFTFDKMGLVQFQYDAYLGKEYHSKSEDEAYFRLKVKVEQLQKEGNKAFGKPDSLSNNMSAKYKPGDDHLYYSKDWLVCRWKQGKETIKLEFSERGGGKMYSPVFHLYVSFERAM